MKKTTYNYYFNIKKVHASSVINKSNTVVLVDGEIKTLGKNLHYDSFYGYTIYGHPCILDKNMVDVVDFGTKTDTKYRSLTNCSGVEQNPFFCEA